MSRLGRGRADALGALYRRHGKRLYNYLARIAGRDAADDLVQETFMRVLKSSSTYDPRHKFSSWLYTIATNAARTHLARTAGPRAMISLSAEGGRPAPDPPVADSPAPSGGAQRAERAETVRAALARLDAAEREVVVLRHYEGLKFREIADVTGANLSTVKSRMRYALDKLGRMLGKVSD
jgi:RNA polymerase sigma-70 factor (ECF subfamily)